MLARDARVMGQAGPVRPLIRRAAVVGLAIVAAAVTMTAPGQPATGAVNGSSAGRSPAGTLPLAGRVVALDPGHQLGNGRFPDQIDDPVWVGFWKPCNTTGTATSGGFPEATFAWRVAQRLRARLEAAGATVRMTRTTNSNDDWGPCVDRRGRFGARVGADLMVSLHGDGAAPSTRGFFVIRPGWREGYTDDIARPSRRLARDLRTGLLVAGFPVTRAYGGDGLDVRRDLGTLNMSDTPTALVELGNMRNRTDARCMTSRTCRARYAGGVARGVTAFLTGAAGVWMGS